MKFNILASVLIAGSVLAAPATAAVVRVSEAAFQPTAGLITFSEFALGTVNPTYTPGDYGGGVGAPTVNFDGFFVGQSLSGNSVLGSPTGPLALDAAAPDTRIVSDGAAPNSPVLSGSPTFNGPIAVLFSDDQFGVGFDAGFFDAIGGTAIQAFARDGTLLGSVLNVGLGIEFLGLVSDTADIAGVLLNIVGNEPAGYAIDSLRFGRRGDIIIDPAPIPLPAAGWMLLAGLGGLVAMRRRKPA